jgi:hypothetical protein
MSRDLGINKNELLSILLAKYYKNKLIIKGL